MKKILCLLFVFSSACSHNKKPEEAAKAELDLPSSNEKALIKGGDPSSADPKAVFAWQRYYQNPPSPSEQETLSSVVSKEPASLEESLRQARNTLALGRRTEAKDLYALILKNHKGQLDAQIELTHIYLAENNVERAFDYLLAIRKDIDQIERPSSDHVYRYRFALAQTYIQSQSRKKGHQILTDLLALETKFIPAYAALAQSYIQTSKLAQAEFILKRGMDRNGQDPRLSNLMAVISLRLNNQDEARDWLRKALEKDPNFVPALINRANLAIQRREYAIAENDLKKSVGLEPLNAEASVSLGILYRRTGRVTAAKAALERAMEIDPLSAAARFHLAGLMAEDMKDPTSALQLYYDVLQAREEDSELKNQANIKIQAIRDSRLYQ